MQPINVGIAGYGLSGRIFHASLLRSLPKLFKLRAVATSRTDILSGDFQDVRAEASYESLIGRSDVELIIVALPNALHLPVAKAALAAGKHVLIEKPFVPTSDDGFTLLTAAKEANRVLTVFHNRRFDGDYLTVKELIAKKTLGDLALFESRFDRFRPEVDGRWKETAEVAGGSLFDLGAHLIDQTLQLFGEPETVSADLGRQRKNAQNPDYFNLVMKYGELRCILSGSSIAAYQPYRFLLHGTKGSFRISGLDPQEGHLKEGILPGDPRYAKNDRHGFLTAIGEDGVLTDQMLHTAVGEYQKFYEELHGAIRFGNPLSVTAGEALAVIKIIEAAYTSDQEKRTVNLKNG